MSGVWVFAFQVGLFPKALGVLMAIAGLSYLTNSFTLILAPTYAATILPIPLRACLNWGIVALPVAHCEGRERPAVERESTSGELAERSQPSGRATRLGVRCFNPHSRLFYITHLTTVMMCCPTFVKRNKSSAPAIFARGNREWHLRERAEKANIAQFRCNLSPFRINTSKSVSKQTTLTFRMNA